MEDEDGGKDTSGGIMTEADEAFEEIARPKPAQRFYTTQLDKMYQAELKCFGKKPEQILEQLEQKAEEIKNTPQFELKQASQRKLCDIKADQQIEPEILAKKVREEIDETEEFRNIDQLKDWLYKKKQALCQRHVEAVKNSKDYKELRFLLDIDAEMGKQIEITCDFTGQIYLICQYANHDGPHLAIFTFDIETGEVDGPILQEQLIEEIEGDEVVDDHAFANVEEQVEDKEQSPVKKEPSGEKKLGDMGKSKSKLAVSMLFSAGNKRLFDFNCFNRIWTKRWDSIYFWKIKNNHIKQEHNLEMIRFNLNQRTTETLRTPTLTKIEMPVLQGNKKDVVMRKPFGINCICFQEHGADNVLQRDMFMQEPMFLARQMVLVIYDDYKFASLRSVNDMRTNIIACESKLPVTWTLYRHDKLVGSSFSPVEIGGMTNLKTYKQILTGNLYKPMNRPWQFKEIEEDQLNLLPSLESRYKSINNLIYTKQLSKAGKVHFSRQRMQDEDNLLKKHYLKMFEIEIRENQEKQNAYQELMYLKQSFQFDTFMILQNYLTNKTFLFISNVQARSLRVFQLKCNTNQEVVMPWSTEGIHPITKMQYKHQENLANLVQVHPLFADIMSDGEKFLSYEESTYKLSKQLRYRYKPKYLDEFLDDDLSNKYMKEYPSSILQLANDDRQFIPRLGIDESKNDDSLIYIDIHDASSQKELFDNECQKQIKHDMTQTPSKRKLFINALHYGWKELEVSSRFFTTAFQPSSSIELIDEEKQLYKQNWQVCCLDHSQLVIYIYEYQLKWSDKPLNSQAKASRDDYNLLYLGKSLIILQQPWKVHKRINFLPYYPNNDDQLIGGTQLMPEFNSTSKLHIIFENQNEKNVQIKTDLCNCSYKIYQNTSRNMIGFIIRTRMCDNLLYNYTDTQKNLIFDLCQRNIANMTLIRDDDIDQFIAQLTSNEPFDPQVKQEIHVRPQEMLFGQTLVDYTSHSPNIHTRIGLLSNPNWSQHSLLGMIQKAFDPAKKKKHLESMLQTLPKSFISDTDDFMEIIDDLFYNNPINRCFDDLNRKSKSLNSLISYDLKKPQSMWVHSRMMQILPQIVALKLQGFQDYKEFFIDYDGRDELTTFAIKIHHTQLPDFGVSNQTLRRLTEARNSNSDNRKMIINGIINEYHHLKHDANVPNQHFIIDFRNMLLGNKIRCELQDSDVKELVNFTKYNMHYMMYRIAQKYGEKIDQFDTLRAIIDYQYYHRTKKEFTRRFFMFVLFFLIPFMIQLFSNEKTLGYCMNFCCLTQVLSTLFHIRIYFRVEGLRKVLRKTSYLNDMTLAFLYLIYLVLRTYHNWDKEENRSTLPSAANTPDASVNLAVSIILNLGISFCTGFKIMAAMKVDETMGLLWRLVAKCFIELWPFTIFLFIWLIFFECLYKIIGSQLEVGQEFPGVDAFWAGFFFNFQIAANNALTPSFSIWAKLQKLYKGKPWGYLKILSKAMIYLIYLIWFLQQIFLPVILLNFIIAFISGIYQKSREKKNILLIQQKSELTREYLAMTKSMKIEREIDCLALSANTFDESLGTNWYKFIQNTKKILRETIEKMKERLEVANEQQDAFINQFKANARAEMKANHESIVKEILHLTENATSMK